MAEMFLSLHDVGEELGVSVQTVRRWVKAGELAAYQPGKEYRIKSGDLEEFLQTREVRPKAAAPPSDSDERRRLTQVPEVLGAYIFGRTERHEAELESIDSPHFRSATSATLWLAAVEEEATAWTDWALTEAAGIMPVPRADSTVSNLVERFYDGLEIMAFRIPFEGLKSRAEARIAAMNGAPDALALKRLEKADAAVDEVRERLEELRTANG